MRLYDKRGTKIDITPNALECCCIGVATVPMAKNQMMIKMIWEELAFLCRICREDALVCLAVNGCLSKSLGFSGGGGGGGGWEESNAESNWLPKITFTMAQADPF